MFVAPVRFSAHQQRTYVKNRGATVEDQSDIIEFRQNQPGKAVVVPLSDAGVSIESADVGVSAVLVIALP
jgi:hypothetical protein